MKKLLSIKYLIPTLIIILGVVIDQVTKLLAVTYLKPVATVPIINDVIHLTYHTNKGMAFGMLQDARWVFITVSLITIVAMLFWLYSGRCKGRLYVSSVCLIVSGGIGNMIDRIALGEVNDFIDFRLINFAIFNGADSFVCIGAGLLILALIRDIIKETKEKKEKQEDEQ